jgi:hypothetical protein
MSKLNLKILILIILSGKIGHLPQVAKGRLSRQEFNVVKVGRI